MAQEALGKTKAKDKTTAAEFRPARQGWLENDICPLQELDCRSQDTSYETDDL